MKGDIKMTDNTVFICIMIIALLYFIYSVIELIFLTYGV